MQHSTAQPDLVAVLRQLQTAFAEGLISENELTAARQRALSQHSTGSNTDRRLVNNVARWHKEMGEWLVAADTVRVDSPGLVRQNAGPSAGHSLDRCPTSQSAPPHPKQTKKVHVVFSYQSQQAPFLERLRQELNRSGIDTVDGTQVCCLLGGS